MRVCQSLVFLLVAFRWRGVKGAIPTEQVMSRVKILQLHLYDYLFIHLFIYTTD
jgi:hypothetical protein